MVDLNTPRRFGTMATGLQQIASPLARRARLAAMPSMLAAVLLLPGLARGQTITATSAQDYVTAITEANGPPPAGVTVINSPAGTVISLGSVTLPAIGTNAVLQIGSNTVDSPISFSLHRPAPAIRSAPRSPAVAR
jgi:hypothetical protein